jgi:Kef-type K+ transport system membrane component KefB
VTVSSVFVAGVSVVIVLVCANASGAISVQARALIVFLTMMLPLFVLMFYPKLRGWGFDGRPPGRR